MSLINVFKRAAQLRELNQAEFDQNMDAIIQLQTLFWAEGVVKDSLRLGGKLPHEFEAIFFSQLDQGLEIPPNWQDQVAGLTIGDLQNLGITEILEKLLFPTIQASILTNKFVSLATSGESSIVEVGKPLTLTLSASFNQGSIQDGDGSANANALVGAATNYRFTGTGIVQTDQAGNSLAVAIDAILGTNQWAVEVTHDAGAGDYFDNKNNLGSNLDAQRVAGSVSDTSNVIQGRLANYMGFSEQETIDSATIISFLKTLSTNKTLSVGSVSAGPSDYLFYCYPSSYGDLSNIILDGASPILGAFTRLADVSVTNMYGIVETYAVYRSNATNAFTNNTLDFS